MIIKEWHNIYSNMKGQQKELNISSISVNTDCFKNVMLLMTSVHTMILNYKLDEVDEKDQLHV